MARTKAGAGKKAGGKASRKAPVLKNTPSSGGITKHNLVKPGSSKDVNLASETEVIDLEPEENSSTAGFSSAASAAAGSSEDPIPDSEDCDTSMNEDGNGEKVAAEDNSMNIDQGNNGEDGSSEGEVGKEDPREINEGSDETYGTAENEKKDPKENDEGDYKDGKAEKEEEDPIENYPGDIEEGDLKNGKAEKEEEGPNDKELGENAEEDCDLDSDSESEDVNSNEKSTKKLPVNIVGKANTSQVLTGSNLNSGKFPIVRRSGSLMDVTKSNKLILNVSNSAQKKTGFFKSMDKQADNNKIPSKSDKGI